MMDSNVPCPGREGVHRKQVSVRRPTRRSRENTGRHGDSTCASATVRVEPTPRV
uniref:Uncharacterized protein n=1 Tax=Arundo donax TaxID=35708 RepID=A0A0A9AAC7_ARUDO